MRTKLLRSSLAPAPSTCGCCARGLAPPSSPTSSPAIRKSVSSATRSTTMRMGRSGAACFAWGDEDPRQLVAHFIRASELVFDPIRPGFSAAFMLPEAVDELYSRVYLDAHTRWLHSQPPMKELLQ